MDMSMIFLLIKMLLQLMYSRYSEIFNEKAYYKIMFGFVKQVFIGLLNFGRLLVFDGMKYVYLGNKPCKAESTLVDINSNEPIYYP